MPIATNQQMQTYCDTRIRPFAEAARALLIAAQDHKSSIDDEYNRATSNQAWVDARTDGPSHLLQSGNSANPDDMLNFNAFVTNLISFMNSSAEWAVLQKACVRPAGL